MHKVVRAIGLAALFCSPLMAYAQTSPTEARPPEAAATGRSDEVETIDTIVVIGTKQTYAASATTESMEDLQTPISSALDIIDDLPGVLINQGDPYGFDDWSTTISIRGFSVDLGQQQIGMTIDGLPNGNSNYGGGAKVNRYIDSPNLGGAEVSQGTADIASRSHEALGGTINFYTSDPLGSERMRVQYAAGSFDAQKLYLRYDTPMFLGNTSAWISASSQDSTDFFEGSAQQRRDHIAAKLVSSLGGTRLTGYLAYDDVHEDNMNSVTPEEFADDPTWDRLTGDWTGVPTLDQMYRRAWSTLRDNLFGYLRAEHTLFGSLDLNGALYYHKNNGRGDWIPPYLVDVIDDNGGPESELDRDTYVGGGDSLGQVQFVDPNGVALSPDPACTSNYGYPYGGDGPAYHPACYPANAQPVSSYRHTNYRKERYGLTADFSWVATVAGFDNTLRGGVWYEDSDRDEWRTWHRVLVPEVGPNFDDSEYWRQYDRSYPVVTTMYYLEEGIDFGDLSLRGGIKQFFVELEREDGFQGGATTAKVDSDSDVLFSGGAVYRLPVDGLEVFAGYAENFAAMKDGVLEAGATALERIEPEQADNFDIGLRYASRRFSGSATYYNITFDNRIVFVAEGTAGAIDYLGESSGAYLNVGGVESSGFELAGDYRLNRYVNFYAAYTNNDSTYRGTGDSTLDESLGIAVDNTVAGSVEQQYVVAAHLRKDRYFGGVSYKWVDARWLDAGNEQRLSEYAVMDLYAGVAGEIISGMLKGYDLRLNVLNALDESYLGGTDGGGYSAYIGAPRTVVLSLSADF